MLFVFYHSVYKSYVANHTFFEFISQRNYTSPDEFFKLVNKNLSFEITSITLGVGSFLEAMLNSPEINQDFVFRFASLVIDKLQKELCKAPEDYEISLKLANLFLSISARDKRYLPQAEIIIRQCVKISPVNPYNKELYKRLRGLYED